MGVSQLLTEGLLLLVGLAQLLLQGLGLAQQGGPLQLQCLVQCLQLCQLSRVHLLILRVSYIRTMKPLLKLTPEERLPWTFTVIPIHLLQ